MLKSTAQWLQSEPCVSILGPGIIPASKRLLRLCESEKNSNQGMACVGLEYHHREPKPIDLSIYGHMALVKTSTNAIPDWLYGWLNFLETSKLNHCFPQEFWLEYDDHSTHYELAGLFQKCELSKLRTNEVITLLLDYYVYSNREIDRSASRANQRWLAELFEIFNKPEWIGLMSRKREVVKLIMDVSHIKTSADIDNFQRCQQLGILSIDQKLLDVIQLWTSIAKARVSIDFSWEQSKPSQKLGLELLIPKGEWSKNSSSREILDQIYSILKVQEEQISSSMELRDRLPKILTRPRVNLTTEESIIMAINHVKLCLSPNSTDLKDYILITCMKEFT